MAAIRIMQAHTLSDQQARAVSQQAAEQLSTEYEMNTEWDGDCLRFKRSGVSGTLTLTPNLAQLDITLGFLLDAFADRIEAQVSKNMKKMFCTES